MTTTLLVTQVTGQAWIRGADGALTALRPGMRVPGDADIVTATGGSVQLDADGLPSIVIGENREVQLGAQAFEADVDSTAAAVGPAPDSAVAQVLAALNDGADPFDELDPTAAVLPGGPGGAGGSNFTRLMDIVETTTPLGLEYPRPAGGASISLMQGAPGGGIPDNDDASVQEPALQVPPPSLAIADANALEPGQVTIAEDAAGAVSGSFSISAAAGVAFLTVGNTTLTAAQLGDLAANPFTIQAAHGQIILTGFEPGTGKVSYEYRVDGSQDHSRGDDTVNDIIPITVTDSSGRQASDSLGIHITDTEPLAQNDDGGQLVEDGLSNTEISGNVLGNDTVFDGPGAVNWHDAANTGVLQTLAQFGSIALETDGQWRFTLDSSKPAVQALAEDQVIDFNIHYVLTDADGDSIRATLSFSVKGTNDMPVITSGAQSATMTEIADNAAGENATEHAAAGTITFTDVDTLDAHSASVQAQGNGYLGTLVLGSVDAATKSVGWDFTVDDSVLDSLAAGQELTQTYTVTISDGKGGAATQDITITIVGTNDAPVILSGNQGGTITEIGDHAFGENVLPHLAGGLIRFSDVDTTDRHTASVQPQESDYLGTLTLSPVGQITNSVVWAFSVGDGQLDSLAAGEILVQKYDVAIDDGHGGTAVQTITITLVGTNDAPVVTSTVQAAAITEVEDGKTGENATEHAATGAITFADVDLTDEHTATFTANGNGYLGTLVLGDVDQAGNSVGWDFKVQDSVLDSLAAGQELTQTYTVTISDGKGGTATQDITITITGTNDAPVISGPDTGAVQEDGTLTAQGQLTVADVDTTDMHTWSIDGDGQGTYGSFALDATGKWVYTLDNTKPEVQSLNAGDTRTETFTVLVDDGNGGIDTQSVTITIHGDDDSGSVTVDAGTGNDAGKVYEAALGDAEDGRETTTGTISVSSTDGIATVTIGGTEYALGDWLNKSVDTGEGTLTITSVTPAADGKSAEIGYRYTLKGAQTHDNATSDDQITDTIVVTVDGIGGSTASGDITISIVDDVPVAHAINAGAVTEDDVDNNTVGGDVKADAGNVFGADGEHATTAVTWGDTIIATLDGVTVNLADYGNLLRNESGTWSFTLDNTKAATQELKAGERIDVSFTYSLTDKDGDTDNGTIKFTVNGTNDAPVITSSPAVATISEEGLPGGIKDTGGNPDTTDKTVATGQITFTDVDTAATGISVSLTVPATEVKSHGAAVQWGLSQDGQTLLGTANGQDVIKVTIDDTGSYKVEVLGPVDHPDTTTEDVISLNVGVVVSDGTESTPTTITINIEDDSPTVVQTDVVAVASTGIPDVYTGMVSFADGADQSGQVLTFANGAVEVTAKGFKAEDDLTLVAADVVKDSNGLGVDSVGPYFPIPGEVDFRKTAEGSASEELTIRLTDGKVAYGAKIGFADMFGGELERGVAEFYRDGVLIATQEFSSDKSSGNYAADFVVEEGGFDTIVLKALDNTQPHDHNDNSDFTVTSIEFLGTSEVKAFASAEGNLNYQYGADGAGGIVLTGAEEGLKTLAGLDVTSTMVNSNLVQGRDSNDALVYELRLTPATGKWELFQYQYMAHGNDGKIDFSFKVTDADGDSAEGVFQVAPATIPPNEVPVALGGALLGHEDVSVLVTWASFAITDDSPATDLGVTITGLPANGMLQYKDAGAGWKAVTEGQVISKADIDAGKLRFIPGANESGMDGYGGTVGNKADDYAHIKFSPTDGEHIGTEATLVIDIAPVADKPNLSISLGDPSTTITDTMVAFGEHTFTIDGSGVGASGTATVWNVLATPPGNGKFNGTGNQSDIFVLAGNVTAAIKELNGAGGNHADDFVYLGKSREHYEITYEKSNAHSRDYHGTIKDLDSGETVSFKNIEGLVYGDGTSEFGDAVVTTQGYETIAIDLAASLTDTDGSETLSPITLTGLPAGVTLLDGDGHAILPNADGSWTLDHAQLPGLSMQVPLGTAAFDVRASVTSTESVGGDAKTAEVSSGVQQHTVMTGTSQDDTLEGSDANDVVVADVTGLTVVPGQNYNIAFIVDTSGSMDDNAIESAKASLTEVFNALLQSAGTDNSGKVNIYLSDFDDGVRKMVSVDLADPQALSRLQGVLDSMASGGGTNYEAAFKDAANWFQSSEVTGNAGTNLTYFITDGKPTFYQSGEGGNPLVYTAQNGTKTNLSGLLDFSNYKPGDVVVKDGKTIVDADGNVSKWHYQSGGCNSGWKSESIGQITADGAGGYEFSTRAGTGNTTPTDTVSNSLAGFALLEDLSVVNAIGLGGELSIDDLKNYDTDGRVQTNIDPADLAAAILGSNETLPNGADTVHGGEGNDIIFGDAVSFGDVDGYNALKAYVADKANVGVHTLSNKDIHQYISDNAAEFNRSDARDGNDTLYGDAGDDILFGQGGDDLLYGGAGDDTLYGGTGSDILYGGEGDDYLIGGAGDDTLHGGAGADTFKWNAGDQGIAGAPAKDVIMDFDASEGDVLDLSSLLQDRGAGTLDHFLQASDDGEGGTIIHVSTDGGFAGGDLSAADQTIQLAGVEFNNAIVEQLINSGRLNVDAT